MNEKKHDMNQPEGAAPSGGGSSEQEARPSRARRLLKGVLVALGGLVGLVVVLLLVFVLALQTNWGSQRFGAFITRIANPYDEAQIEVEDIRGNWLSRLELHDVRLLSVENDLQPDTVRLAHVDSLKLRYSLPALFRRTIHVRHAGLYGAQVNARQRADSTWDLLEPFAAPADTAQQAFTFQVDDIEVQDVNLAAAFYAPDRDSTLYVRDLDTRVTDLHIGEEMRFNLESLATQVIPPAKETPYRIDARAALADRHLGVERFRIAAPRSQITAEGTLRLPTEERETVDDVAFTFRAEPLDFSDLTPFAPGLDPEKSLRLTAEVTGSGRHLQADLDATFSDGATLALNGAFTPATEGPLDYQIEGRLRQFDPGFFAAGAEEPSGEINADLHIDLEGAALEELDGTATAELFDTRFAGYTLDPTHLNAQFESGRAYLDLRGGTRGMDLTAEGTIQPFDAEPAYDLTARVTGLDIGRLLDNPEQQSDLAGTLRVEGRGVAPQIADLTATLDLAPSTINRYRLESGQLQARLQSGTLDFETRAAFPEGRLSAQGAAENIGAEEPLRYRLTSGRFEEMNVAALAGDTTRSAFSGTFSLQGEGTDPETMHISEASFRLSDSFYGPYRIQSANLNASLQERRLSAEGTATLQDAGAFQLAAVARPFAPTPSFAITRGSFRNVDIGTLAQSPDQSSDLNGTFTLSGYGTDPQAMHLEGTLALSESQLNAQPIESASAEATLDRGTLDYRMRLDLPEGQSVLAGTAEPFGERLTYAIREGTIRGLNVGALAGLPDLQTDLNADVEMEGSMARAEEPPADTAQASPAFLRSTTLDAQLDLARSTINEATIQDGTFTAQLDSARGRLDGALSFSEGRAELSASGQFAGETPRYEARAVLDNIALADLMGRDTLDSRFSLTANLEGEGLDPETMSLTGTVSSNEAYYADLRLNSLASHFRLDDGLLQVDSLRLHSNLMQVTGGGQIALSETAPASSNFAFEAILDDLSSVQPFLEAEVLTANGGRLEGRVTGPPDTLRFEADASLESLVYNDLQVADVAVTAEGGLAADRTLQQAEVHGDIAYAALPSLSMQNTSFQALYADEEVRFSTGLTLEETQQAQMAGLIDLRPDSRRMSIEQFDMRLGGNRWQLLQEATISYGEAYRISNFLIYSENQQIAVDGVVDFDGEQNLVLTIENFETEAVADLMAFEGLSGPLNGTLVLTGPAQAPILSGTLDYNVVSFDEPVGTLSLSLNYDDLRLGLDAQLMHRDGSTLRADGTLPVDLRLSMPEAGTREAPARFSEGEVDLTVRADSFEIGWMRPFLDPETVNRIDGHLTTEVDIGGTRSDPQLSGDAVLMSGALGLPALGLTYRDIQAHMTFENNQMRLRRASMRSGGGDLTAQGTINLSDLTLGEFDLSLVADEFRAISTRQYQATADADLTLRGTTQQPILRGDVQILSADFYIDDAGGTADVEEVALDEEDLLTLERRFGFRLSEADTTTSDLYQVLAMELNLRIERNVWLRSRANPEMAIQFTGDLELQKESQQDLQLFGSIEVIPERSYITQFGRRFDIATGNLTFNGPVDEPLLDAEARLPIRSRRNPGQDVVITLAVTGRLDDLDLELGANEPMDTADIVSYIATGRPASAAFQFGGTGEGGSPLEPARDIALGQIANFLESEATDELGLDVVEIEVNGLEGAILTAGKYFTRRLFVGVRQPISRSSATFREQSDVALTQVTFEYELTRWLLARLTGSPTTIRVNLFWEYAY